MNKIIFPLIYFCVVNCCQTQSQKIIQNNSKNVLTIIDGALISSKKQNSFKVEISNSIPFRNNPYEMNSAKGLIFCTLNQSIIITMLQKYELNLLKLRLLDLDGRIYNICIYAINKRVETLLFESVSAFSTIKVKFRKQIVEKFKIYNRGGNTANDHLHISKIVASFSTQ